MSLPVRGLLRERDFYEILLIYRLLIDFDCCNIAIAEVVFKQNYFVITKTSEAFDAIDDIFCNLSMI